MEMGGQASVPKPGRLSAAAPAIGSGGATAAEPFDPAVFAGRLAAARSRRMRTLAAGRPRSLARRGIFLAGLASGLLLAVLAAAAVRLAIGDATGPLVHLTVPVAATPATSEAAPMPASAAGTTALAAAPFRMIPPGLDAPYPAAPIVATLLPPPRPRDFSLPAPAATRISRQASVTPRQIHPLPAFVRGVLMAPVQILTAPFRNDRGNR